MPPKTKVPKKIGRPLELVDDDKTINILAGLARIQCTTKEAAAVLNVSEVTFFAFLKRSIKARETWDHSKENGRASLRRNQFKMAENNPTMAIWLGKQYLEQKDKHEVAGDQNQPVRHVMEVVWGSTNASNGKE
jgi:hypothetical protein